MALAMPASTAATSACCCLPPRRPIICCRPVRRWSRIGSALAGAGAVDLAGACAGFIYALTFADGFRPRCMASPRWSLPPTSSAGASIRPSAPAPCCSPMPPAPWCLVRRAIRTRGSSAPRSASDGSGYELIQIPAGGSNRPFAKDLDNTENPDDDRRRPRGVRQGRRDDGAPFDEALAGAELPRGICRFVPHQANTRMFNAVAGNLGIEESRTIATIAEYGNSSAATIPLSLSLAHQDEPLRPGEKLLLAAAGAGLTGGALVVDM